MKFYISVTGLSADWDRAEWEPLTKRKTLKDSISRVALKEILLDFSNLPNQFQQEISRWAFEREAKILTQVDHEAFPQVIDYFTQARFLFPFGQSEKKWTILFPMTRL